MSMKMTIQLLSGLRQPLRTNGVDVDARADAELSSTDLASTGFASVLQGVTVQPSVLPVAADDPDEKPASAGVDDSSSSSLLVATTPPIPLAPPVTSAPIAIDPASLSSAAVTIRLPIAPEVSFAELTIDALEMSSRAGTAAAGNRPLSGAAAVSAEGQDVSVATSLTASPTLSTPPLAAASRPADDSVALAPVESRVFPRDGGNDRSFPLPGSDTLLAPSAATPPATPGPFVNIRLTGASGPVEAGVTAAVLNPVHARTEALTSHDAGTNAQPAAPTAISGTEAGQSSDSPPSVPVLANAISAADQQQPARIADMPAAQPTHDQSQVEKTNRTETFDAAPVDSPSTPALSAGQGSVAANSVANPPAHANPPATTHDLPTPFHDPAWSTEFGHKMLWLARNDHQQAHLTLNPPDLGPIEITVNLNSDSTASAAFVAADAGVRQTLETSLPRLREMFASAGIDLGQVSVGSESFQQSSDGRQHASRTPRGMADKAILSVDLTGVLPTSGSMGRSGGGRVDTFA